jgi:hypothetical protein
MKLHLAKEDNANDTIDNIPEQLSSLLHLIERLLLDLVIITVILK